MDQPFAKRPRTVPARVRLATVAVSVATVVLVFMPALFTYVYANGDPYYCGDFGSVAAGLGGWLAGLLVLAVTVAAVALTFRRLRVLLVLPPVVVVHYVLGVNDPQWPPVLRLCGESLSLLVPVLLVALAGGLTYALTRSARVERPPTS